MNPDQPFQQYAPLPDDIEAALRASIEEFGVLVPVVHDQHGRIIDGHTRSRIAAELGKTLKVEVKAVVDDDEARRMARTLNEDRRHLKPEERRPAVVRLHQQGHSTRAIGEALKVSPWTVREDLKVGAPGGRDLPPVQAPVRVVGRDGRNYPAKRPAPITVPAPLRNDTDLPPDDPPPKPQRLAQRAPTEPTSQPRRQATNDELRSFIERLYGSVAIVDRVQADHLDPALAAKCDALLTTSIRELNRLRKEIRRAL